MERKERIPHDAANAGEVAIREALDQRQSQIWTALPGIVQSFNPAPSGGGTVVVQPAIQAQLRQPDGEWVDTTLPLCLDVPVVFPGGGGFICTFPLAAGDEGLLVFAARCIDAWWQNGGVQKQAELRMHDLSDGFFIPTGGMSQTKKVANVSTTAAEIRTVDGNNVIHLEPNKAILSVNSGGTSITADGTAEKVNVIAPAGLWVNGTMVTVP